MDSCAGPGRVFLICSLNLTSCSSAFFICSSSLHSTAAGFTYCLTTQQGRGMDMHLVPRASSLSPACSSVGGGSLFFGAPKIRRIVSCYRSVLLFNTGSGRLQTLELQQPVCMLRLLDTPRMQPPGRVARQRSALGRGYRIGLSGVKVQVCMIIQRQLVAHAAA
jgi:hypothetical protein